MNTRVLVRTLIETARVKHTTLRTVKYLEIVKTIWEVGRSKLFGAMLFFIQKNVVVIRHHHLLIPIDAKPFAHICG